MRLGAALLAALATVCSSLLGLVAAADPAGALPRLPRLPDLDDLTPPAVVAMGDSYSSGEGAPPLEPGTGDGCRRTYGAYVRLVSLWRATNLACAGATTRSVLRTGQYGEAAQLARLPADARRVALTLGGNDIGFGSIVAGCAVLPDCSAVGREAVDERLAELSDSLPAVYRAILGKARRARLVVLGYPVLLPDRPRDCLRLTGFSTAEQTWARQVNVALNSTIRRAVDEVAATHPGRIAFVPTADRFEGHAVCDRKVDWIRGLYPVRRWSFHPNHLGQVALARALHAALDD